jgi:hypothetical protein
MKFKHVVLLTGLIFAIGITFAGVGEGIAGPPETVGPDTVNRPEVPDVPNRRDPARWEWFEDTYWYVPEFSLTAFVFDAVTNRLREISDQTVFHITDYQAGYFWGKTVVDLGAPFPISCLSLVGSVTPEGEVLLTFTSLETVAPPSDPNPEPPHAPTQGIGTMRFDPRFGGWTIEPQMSSGASEAQQVNHWAYMVQSSEGQASWESLPGVGIPLLDFLDLCDTEAPTLISN